jgi:hypothetical protein
MQTLFCHTAVGNALSSAKIVWTLFLDAAMGLHDLGAIPSDQVKLYVDRMAAGEDNDTVDARRSLKVRRRKEAQASTVDLPFARACMSNHRSLHVESPFVCTDLYLSCRMDAADGCRHRLLALRRRNRRILKGTRSYPRHNFRDLSGWFRRP